MSRLFTGRQTGVNTQMLTKDEVMDKFPYINGEDLTGAIWIPEDIFVNTREITRLMSKLSQDNGTDVILALSRGGYATSLLLFPVITICVLC